MSESYTHLLISLSKGYVPKVQAVCHFLERMVQAGTIGQDYKVSFTRVTKVDPVFREVRRPFTGGILRLRSPSRQMQKAIRLSAIHQIDTLAEHESEYDVALESYAMPAHPPLNVGCVDENDVWQAWVAPHHQEIRCRVRASLVRLSFFKLGEDPHGPPPETGDWNPRFDEDCSEEESDGCFVHPESRNAIHVPNAGCGRFWIEFACGKWLYPRLKNDGVALLNEDVTSLAAELFETAFVEACLWG